MEEFRVCIQCGYERGFHVSFRAEGGKVRIYLICPNCGQSYDIGWLESDIASLEPKKGGMYK